jgi:hypothetical protein
MRNFKVELSFQFTEDTNETQLTHAIVRALAQPVFGIAGKVNVERCVSVDQAKPPGVTGMQ